ncbi:CoA transferase [Sphingomonadaceae bacterium G21617-S1]|nr:CoA transferase [Sphingomonadaceae bacterium G21617-S1]
MTAPPPLEGVRVIDLTRVLAGPFATQTLADLGADVIKVEHPSAPDQFRFREPKLAGESAAFMSLNRNKRSITLDLSTSAGREVVLDLIGQADVLVENYTSRVMRGYGLDYASIGSRFPKLIFCSISAYGRSGSRADAPGYDPVIAAESGVAWLGGVADAPPNLGGIPVIDIATAQNATTAILSALLARTKSGAGQFIEVSLYDSAIACLSYLGYNFLASGEEAARFGRHVALGGPAGFFDASDGIVMIIASSDRDFGIACSIVGLPELAEQEQYRTFSGRLAGLQEINSRFAGQFRKAPRDEWVRQFRAHSVPCAPYLSIGEALASELTEERGMITQIPHANGRTIPNIASPMRLAGTPLVDPIRAPTLGEDNHEILSNMLCYDEERLRQLREQGAFGGIDPSKRRLAL